MWPAVLRAHEGVLIAAAEAPVAPSEEATTLCAGLGNFVKLSLRL